MTEQSNLPVPASDSRMSFGQTELRPEDIVMPRVKIAQQMSQEVADKKADAGDFFNTLTGESYGPTLKVLPILPFMQRVFLVRQERRKEIEDVLGHELTEGDGLKCRSYDMETGNGEPGGDCNECPLSKWREGNKPPLCTETYNVAAATEIGELVILSMAKSGAKAGKRLFSTIRMSREAPWARIFELSTLQQKNDLGNFYVPDFKISAERPDQGQLADALHWAAQLRGVQIDVTPTLDDEEEGGATGDTKAPF